MTITTILTPSPVQRFVDNNGNALTGGKLFTYLAGTTSKVATYVDETGGTPNTNPIVLDSRGEANIWLQPGVAYKFVLSPSTDTDPPTNPIWTVDNINAPDQQITATLPNIAALQANTIPFASVYIQGNASSGSAVDGLYWLNAGDTTSSDNGRSIIVDAANHRYYAASNSLTDINVVTFMTDAQKEDFYSGTSSVDQSSAWNALIAYLAIFGGNAGNDTPNVLSIQPPGTYHITDTINLAIPGSFALWMYGCIFDCAISAFPFIQNGSTPTVPTSADADGQTGGACFADPSPLSYTSGGGLQFVWLYGGKIQNARWGLVLRGAECNGFRWIDPEWDGCNAGFLNYAALQDCEIINMRPEACNVAIVSAATCFTSDNTYWVKWVAQGNAQGSFWGNVTIRTESFEPRCVDNPTFNTWFKAAIGRNTTSSASAANYGGTGTQYGGQNYATMMIPSGRVIFAPGRDNGKNNSIFIDRLHALLCPRGGMALGGINDFTISRVDGEGNFVDTTINASPFTESMVQLWNYGQGTLSHILQGGGLNGSVGPLSTVNVLDAGGVSLIGESITGLLTASNNGSAASPTSPWVSLPNWNGQSVAPNQTPAIGIYNLARGQFGLSFVPNQIGTGSTFVLVTLGGATSDSFMEDQVSTGGGVSLKSKVRFSIPDLSNEPHALILGTGTNPYWNGGLMGYLDVLIRRQDSVAAVNLDNARYLVSMGNQGISINGFHLGSDAASGQKVIVANSASIANFLCRGMPLTITDNVNTDVGLVDTFSGATITLQANLANDYAAATPTTITSPFTIQRTITAFVDSWVSMGDNAGRLEITNNLDPVRIDVLLEFEVLGPQV